MILSIYTDYCPHLKMEHSIEIRYSKVPISGSPNEHFKKVSALCDHVDSCNHLDEYGRCPLFKAAPTQPY